MPNHPLHGKVAVITGASSGIGLATARALHERGVHLVLNARNAERLNAAADEFNALAVAGDICERELPAALLTEALAAHGRCDMVLNNAGVMEVGSINSVDIDRICAMVRINVEAAYRVAYTFVRHFIGQSQGHLINLSSVAGSKVVPYSGAYAGSKHAIEALSEALRMETAGSNVAITCIEPGLVETDLFRDWTAPATTVMNVQRPLQPEDVARCICFALEQPAHVRIPRLMVLPSDHAI